MIMRRSAALRHRPSLRPFPDRPRRLPVGRRRADQRATEALAAMREASKRIVFMTNDAQRSPEEFVRKLWRLGFQASLAEVVTAGAALQFALAGREQRRRGLRDRLARAGRPRRGRGSAGRQQHRVRDPGRRRGGRRPRALQLRRAADRDPGGAARREADRPHPRPHLPDARRALAGQRRGARGARDGVRAHARTRSWASRSRECTRPPATASARAVCSRSATASTSTWRVRGGRAWTPRSCSRARRRRRRPPAAEPSPTYVADSLAALVLTS